MLACLIVLTGSMQAVAENRDLHRRVYTEGVDRILDAAPELVQPILDRLLDATPYAEEKGTGSCSAVARTCRAYAPFRSLWPDMTGSPGAEEPGVDDVLEIVGNESYLTDHYEDWLLDPRFWWIEETTPSYGMSGEGYAGLGHLCPGGCSTSFPAGRSCRYAGNVARENTDFHRTWGLAGLGSAWDSHGAEDVVGIYTFPRSSLDQFICDALEEADVELVNEDYRGTSPGRLYVGADEADRMGLHLADGEDIGHEVGDSQFPPVEYMGRYWLTNYCDSGAIRYLGAAAHALQDAGQPMHVKGVLGNFHSWWETHVTTGFNPDELDRWWGRSETCVTTYAGSTPVECMYLWALDLVAEAGLRAPSTPARGDERVARYLGLVYAVADASRDRDEADEVRRVIDAALMSIYPEGFCANPFTRFGRPANIPPDATWLWLDPWMEVYGRSVLCTGRLEWTFVGAAPPPENADVCHSLGCYGWPECEWTCEESIPIVLFDGSYRKCPDGCARCRSEGVCTYGSPGDWHACPYDCPDIVDAELAALPELEAQMAEQIDRQIAAALAFLYIAATDCAGAEDADGDLILDDADTCPNWFGPTSDTDGDGLGDPCDLCPLRPRFDTGPPAASSQYNRSPLDGAPQDADVPFDNVDPLPTADSDGDDLGDACDLCPYDAFPRDGGTTLPENMDSAFRVTFDPDMDGVGNRCDDCPTVPNVDQANCNAEDEMRRWGFTDGTDRDPADFVGHGDACDATLCVADCGKLAGFGQTVEPEMSPPFCEDVVIWVGGAPITTTRCYPTDPADVNVCAVGFEDPHAAIDYDPEAGHDLAARDIPITRTTEFYGCACRPEEERLRPGSCLMDYCPQEGRARRDGEFGVRNRWGQATYPGQTARFVCPGGGLPCDRIPDHPAYDFRRLYASTTDFGRLGATDPAMRYGTRGNPYEWWYAMFPDLLRPISGAVGQQWNWAADLERDSLPPELRIDKREARRAWVWFRPSGFGRGYGGFSDVRQGNSYWPTDLGGLLYASVEGDLSDELPPIGEVLADLWDHRIWRKIQLGPPYAAGLDPDCPECGEFMFDSPGQVAGGILIANFDATTRTFRNLTPTKLVEGTFDLRSSSVAFGLASDGSIADYWVFGGLDASGDVASDLWYAQRTSAMSGDGGGVVEYFALSKVPIAEGGRSPAGRAGGALAIRGDITNGHAVKERALAGAAGGDGVPPAPDAAGQGRDGLLLVGGDSGAGLLGDIWAFDGSWRLLGALPGVDVGLADAGGAVVGETMWLVGGRDAAGPSADLWRIDLGSGEAERIAPSGAGGPGPRVRPAVAYASTTDELLVFGGRRGASTFSDVWAYGLSTGAWRQVAAGCSGSACPAVTGAEKILPSPARGITVVGDLATVSKASRSWTLASGIWSPWAETVRVKGQDDCNGDGLSDLLWDARCGAGDEGFPAYGRLRCAGGSDVACRAPAAPAAALWQYAFPGLKTVVGALDRVGLLIDRRIDFYAVQADGTLSPDRSIRLFRPGNDVVLAGAHALVADRNGLTVYSLADGREVAATPTCGKARRVFVDGGRAYVPALRSILVLDISDPAFPVVLEDLRLGAVPGSAWTRGGRRCSLFHDAVDLLWDLGEMCRLFGRMAATESGNRLFVETLGGTYVLDFRQSTVPEVSPAMRTGSVADMRVEGPLLYVNRAGRRTSVWAEEDGVWLWAGEHDVRKWVEGGGDVGLFSFHRSPGRLTIGTRQ